MTYSKLDFKRSIASRTYFVYNIALEHLGNKRLERRKSVFSLINIHDDFTWCIKLKEFDFPSDSRGAGSKASGGAMRKSSSTSSNKASKVRLV